MEVKVKIIKSLINLFLFSLLSVVVNLVGILCFGFFFVSIDEIDSNIMFWLYLIFYFLCNLAISHVLIVKKRIGKLFYIHIPISLLAIIPLIFFIGAFYR